MLPAAGGEYAYILAAFGGLPAFLTLWVNVLVIRPATQAVVALTFAEYALALTFPSCDPPRAAVTLLAAAALGQSPLLLPLLSAAAAAAPLGIDSRSSAPGAAGAVAG